MVAVSCTGKSSQPLGSGSRPLPRRDRGGGAGAEPSPKMTSSASTVAAESAETTRASGPKGTWPFRGGELSDQGPLDACSTSFGLKFYIFSNPT